MVFVCVGLVIKFSNVFVIVEGLVWGMISLVRLDCMRLVFLLILVVIMGSFEVMVFRMVLEMFFVSEGSVKVCRFCIRLGMLLCLLGS